MANFYICNRCKNIATKLLDFGPDLFCCGEKMTALRANTVDAAVEKHVPVITRSGSKVHVKVGSALHPMEPEHYNTFIALESEGRLYLKSLKPGDPPEAEFDVPSPVTAYEYCNLHGLWQSEE